MAMIVYGPAYSTYAATVRLVLEEKGAAYELVEVDILKGANKQPEHLARQPFGQVPAFEHDGFVLYETSAIARYLDRVLPGPRLTPEEPRAEARMNQVIGIVDSHAYGAMVLKIAIQRLIVPMMGGQPDEAVIEAAMPTVRTSLAELERLIGAGPYVAGENLSLSDLHLAPVFAYFTATPEGGQLLASHPSLQRWWQDISSRPSMVKAAPKLG